ncbi:hypothetical protein N866_12150 [Actinotalea ferrariae CF5-4]|uniref:Uncharacterized protein n=1 Tax=Actinotalea ferrariae CF5-4 TaxID=948458 RepID=A0A021VLF8_9CELL|nr:hypothetical protein [Actinotalea ferrariae]EYR62069.1 hypothetical protein N866_12150 [Actinotalea ferrariae CF5-4]
MISTNPSPLDGPARGAEDWRARVMGDPGFPPRLRKTAAGLLVLTAVVWSVAMSSAMFLPDGHPAREWLHPDWEYTVPAFYSAALLVTAAIAGFLAGRSTLWYRFLGLGLLGMGIDELFVVHETLEYRLGVDWQLLYLPVVAIGLVVVVLVHRHMRAESRAAELFMLAGVACWGVAQLLELIQWDGDVQRPGYGYMMGIEEGLEMTGTVAFVLAFLAVLAARAHSGTRVDA